MKSTISVISDLSIIRRVTETKLVHMKDLKNNIKVLQSEWDMMKDEVIGEYFVNYEEYKTDKGMLLATYKQHKEKRFNSTRFREDHPDVYEMYSEEKGVFKFITK